MLEDHIDITNIDRKQVTYCSDTRYKSDGENIYSSPVVIIVKNEAGRRLFNEFVQGLDFHEKNAVPLTEGVAFPQYILTMTYITMGCNFGFWEYFSTQKDLAMEVELDTMKEDFPAFDAELRRALAQPDVIST